MNVCVFVRVLCSSVMQYFFVISPHKDSDVPFQQWRSRIGWDVVSVKPTSTTLHKVIGFMVFYICCPESTVPSTTNTKVCACVCPFEDCGSTDILYLGIFCITLYAYHLHILASEWTVSNYVLLIAAISLLAVQLVVLSADWDQTWPGRELRAPGKRWCLHSGRQNQAQQPPS